MGGVSTSTSNGVSVRGSKHPQAMQMVCTRNEYETVSIYYDTTHYTVDPVDSNNLLLAIQEAFARECGEWLSKVSARIVSVVDSVDECVSEVEDIRRGFEFFALHIDRIITTAFPPTLPLPPPLTAPLPHSTTDDHSDTGRERRRQSNRSAHSTRSAHSNRTSGSGSRSGSRSSSRTHTRTHSRTRSGDHSDDRASHSSSTDKLIRSGPNL